MGFLAHETVRELVFQDAGEFGGYVREALHRDANPAVI